MCVKGLLGCRFWNSFDNSTASDTSPSAAECDEDDAIQDGQTDEHSHANNILGSCMREPLRKNTFPKVT